MGVARWCGPTEAAFVCYRFGVRARRFTLCLWSFIIASAWGCGDDGSQPVDAFTDGGTCMPPGAVSVSCEPLPEGTTEPGCSGPAMNWTPVPGGDADTVWPIGCQVQYPYCLEAYPSFVAECFCLEGLAPSWNCPI